MNASRQARSAIFAVVFLCIGSIGGEATVGMPGTFLDETVQTSHPTCRIIGRIAGMLE